MKFTIKTITISQLMEWIKKDRINLHPPMVIKRSETFD